MGSKYCLMSDIPSELVCCVVMQIPHPSLLKLEWTLLCTKVLPMTGFLGKVEKGTKFQSESLWCVSGSACAWQEAIKNCRSSEGCYFRIGFPIPHDLIESRQVDSYLGKVGVPYGCLKGKSSSKENSKFKGSEGIKLKGRRNSFGGKGIFISRAAAWRGRCTWWLAHLSGSRVDFMLDGTCSY